MYDRLPRKLAIMRSKIPPSTRMRRKRVCRRVPGLAFETGEVAKVQRWQSHSVS
jgi:hypothetical protein